MSVDHKGNRLVIAQLVALAGVAAPGRRRYRLTRLTRLTARASLLGGAALAAGGMGSLGRRLRVTPRPADDAVLRTSGAYAVTRHPIYAGTLLSAAGLALLRGRRIALLSALGLGAVLHLKAGYEERLLHERFGDEYDEYSAAVPRLLGVPRLRDEC